YRTGRSRLLGQLPGLYLLDERRWIPRRSAFLRPPPEHGSTETGRWNAVCIDCHATNGKRGLNGIPGSQALDTLVADTTVAEFGIACEACHGPGEAHIQSNHNPLRRYRLHLTGEPDPTSVKPTRLDARRGSQVCGQCHSTSLRYDRAGIDRPPAPPYQPGRDLDATHFVLQPTTNRDTPLMQTILESDPAALRDSFWSDGMVRVSGREYNGLIDSPCFTNARDTSRTLSCFSCHTMHKAPDDRRTVRAWADGHQLSSKASGNEACLQCHPSFRSDLRAHTKHEAGSSGSECYNCHMPYTSYGLLRALRSHQISSPTVAASVETGRPNACNLCHLDKTLAWTGDALARWYGTPQPPLGEDETAIPASVLWTLRGDAGQRALMAFSLGWPPAQQTSGTTWIAPTLSVLMNDPYEAVRLIAYRSLKTLPVFRDFRYEFSDDLKARTEGVMRVMDLWRRSGALAQAPTAPALLVDATGTIKPDVTRLLRLRDHRRIDLRE
ncbi:MAG: cytochrome c3 family protein, partial [Vicinamibacterales bacterium]